MEPKRKTVRLQDYDYSTPGTYFLTLCTKDRRCVLSRIVGTGVLDGPLVQLLPWGKIADGYIRQIGSFYTDLLVEDYVIMPNHIHLLVTIHGSGPSRTPVPTQQNSTISRFVSTFKRFCNRDIGENIWQTRSYDHIIRDEQDYIAHLRYIQDNPFGWQKDPLYERNPDKA